MTTQAPERTPLTTPAEGEPEPIIGDWSRITEGDFHYTGVIVRDLDDNSVWLLHNRSLYRAFPGRYIGDSNEARWIHDDASSTQRSTLSQDAQRYALTRFERRNMRPYEPWDPPVTDLNETAREVTRSACRAIVVNLNTDYFVEQVDDLARDAMQEWADHANKRSREDDMCGVYDSSVVKYNDQVAGQYECLRWPERVKPTEEREITVEVPYTIEGTVSYTVMVEVDPDLDDTDEEVREAIDEVIDDYDWNDVVVDHVRYSYPDITVQTTDWEYE